MSETTMEVRSAGGAAILDIRGDVTAGSEDVLMAPTNRPATASGPSS